MLLSDSFFPSVVARWPDRVKPQEPAHGLFQRLTAANYFPSTSAFSQFLGFSRQATLEQLLDLFEGTGIVGCDDLILNSPARNGNGIRMGAVKDFGARDFLSRKFRRVCPACLEADRYYRNWFDILIVQSCPDHNVELIGELGEDPVEWRSPIVGALKTGLQLNASHATTRNASDLDKLIVDRVRGQTGDAERSIFQSESLGAILQVSRFLGASKVGGNLNSWRQTRVAQLQAGFPILQEGWVAIERVLKDKLSNRAPRAQYAVNTPAIVANFFLPFEGSALVGELKERMSELGVRHGYITPTGRLAGLAKFAEGSTKKELFTRHRVSKQHFDEVLRRLSIEPAGAVSGKSRRLTPEQAETIDRHFSECLSVSEFAKEFDMAPKDIKRLVDAVVLRRSRTIAGEAHIHPDEWTQLMDRLADRCVSVGQDTEVVAIREWCRVRRTSVGGAIVKIANGKPGIVAASLDKDLPIDQGLKVKSGRNGLKVKSDRRRSPHPPVGLKRKIAAKEGLLLSQAASRLGISFQTLYALLDKEYLTLHWLESIRYVAKAEIEQFTNQYGRASEFADALGVTRCNASRFLAKKGVHSIVAAGKHKQSIVCKAHVARVLRDL